MKITAHALSRMEERDISISSVEAVIRTGIEQHIIDGKVKYSLEAYTVVMDGDLVVTVYRDGNKRGNKWSPKKRQQRCREKEHKPTFIEGRGLINISHQKSLMKQMKQMKLN